MIFHVAGKIGVTSPIDGGGEDQNGDIPGVLFHELLKIVFDFEAGSAGVIEILDQNVRRGWGSEERKVIDPVGLRSSLEGNDAGLGRGRGGGSGCHPREAVILVNTVGLRSGAEELAKNENGKKSKPGEDRRSIRVSFLGPRVCPENRYGGGKAHDMSCEAPRAEGLDDKNLKADKPESGCQKNDRNPGEDILGRLESQDDEASIEKSRKCTHRDAEPLRPLGTENILATPAATASTDRRNSAIQLEKKKVAADYQSDHCQSPYDTHGAV